MIKLPRWRAHHDRAFYGSSSWSVMNHFLFLFLIEYEKANEKFKFNFSSKKIMMMKRSYRLKIIVNCFSHSNSFTLHLKMRKIIIRYTSRKRENLYSIIIFQVSFMSNRNSFSSISIYLYSSCHSTRRLS